jgi:hypothetical protein
MLKQLIQAICFRLINGPLGAPTLEFRISKLEIKPGDFLVVRSRQRMSQQTADRLRESLKGVMPTDVKCLVFDGEIDLSVLTPPEQIALAA